MREYDPQLATLAKSPPTGDMWVHEIKLDGYRVGCLVRDGRIRLISRKGLDWTATFPEIVEAFRVLGLKDALVDGELAVVLPDGRTSFESMQQAVGRRPPRRGLVYFAFDLLRLDDERIDRLPLEARKARLLDLVGDAKTGRLRFAEHIEGNGSEVFAHVCRLGLEGIVSKRRDLPYQPGRGDGWRKVKCLHRGRFVVGGFTDQAGTQDGLGALLVGRFDGSRLVYCGRVGTGFSRALAQELRRTLEAIVQRECPFEPPPPGALARTAHWVKPAIVCEATYSDWTAAGVLRQPAFHGITSGVRPRDVRVASASPRRS